MDYVFDINVYHRILQSQNTKERTNVQQTVWKIQQLVDV